MDNATAVTIHVDAGQSTGPYKPLWNWFGYDEPNFTYTANGKKLLGELAALSPEPVRVRAHNLLTSGDGTPALKWGSTNAYSEDSSGSPVYDWTIMDRIFDAYVEAATVPFIQVGFTPEALSDDPGPYQHGFSPADRYATITTGWAAPPNDLGKWSGLIEAWASHLSERYGHERVTGWPWEVWNEPDGAYWTGTIPEFCRMYDATAAAIKKVLPGARVGGPHTCGAFKNEKAQTFLRAFLTHCAETGSPLDFVAFHAKGRPEVHESHVRMGIAKHLNDIATNLSVMSEFPAFKALPAIIGESDPEGCAACSARVHPQNGYRNGPLYGAYVVEHIVRTYELARRAGIDIEGAVTWAFLFEDQPYFDGFRDLATNGIDKAVLNAFRMLGMLRGDWIESKSSHALPLERILEEGVRGAPDINAVATGDGDGLSILLWNYHDDDVPAAAAAVSLSARGLDGASATVKHFRMDHDHGNAYAVWQGMGSPQSIDGDDYRRLEEAGQLAQIDEGMVTIDDGVVHLDVMLPRQAVSLVRVDAG